MTRIERFTVAGRRGIAGLRKLFAFVKTERGIAVRDHPEPLQRPYHLGEEHLGMMFEQKDAAGIGADTAAKEPEHLVVIRIEGRVKVNEIPGPLSLGNVFEEGYKFHFQNFAVSVFHAELLHVLPHITAHPCGPVNKCAQHSSARYGLEPECSRAATKIKKPARAYTPGQNLEHDLADASRRRPHVWGRKVLEHLSAMFPVGYLQI